MSSPPSVFFPPWQRRQFDLRSGPTLDLNRSALFAIFAAWSGATRGGSVAVACRKSTSATTGTTARRRVGWGTARPLRADGGRKRLLVTLPCPPAHLRGNPLANPDS